MSDVKWIKLNVGIFDDEKIRLIEKMPSGDSLLLIWIKLLALAGQKNMRGELFLKENIPYTPEMLATIFNRDVGIISLAIKTFENLGMIQIRTDQVIVIQNWHKHQNIDGLEKIRLQHSERQKRFREKSKTTNLLEFGASSNVTHTVTSNEVITPDDVSLTPEKEKENKEQEQEQEEAELEDQKEKQEKRQNVEHCCDAGRGLTQHAEAKAWLSELFKRQREWTCEEEELLRQVLPINREDKELIEWAYRLPHSDSFFEQTRLKQQVRTLLADLNGEIDKIRSIRNRLKAADEWVGRIYEDDDWPAHGRAAFRELWDQDRPLPKHFSDLSPGDRQRVMDRVDWPEGTREAIREMWGDTYIPARFDELDRSLKEQIQAHIQKKRDGGTIATATNQQ